MKRTLYRVSAIAALVIAGMSCNNVMNNIPYQEAEIINANISAMSYLSQRESTGEFCEDGLGCADAGDGYRLVQGYIDNLYIRTYDPQMWPGFLVDGGTVLPGVYSPLTRSLAPIRIRIDFNDESVFTDIASPSHASIRESIEAFYASTNTSQVRIAEEYKIETVYSPEHLRVILGTHLAAPSGKVDSAPEYQFDFNSGARLRKLVTIMFVFYEIEMVDPRAPADMFPSNVSWDELRRSIGSTVSPIFVSRCKYGKLGFLCIESSEADDNIIRPVLHRLIRGIGESGDSVVIDKSLVSASVLMTGNDSSFNRYGACSYDELAARVSELKDNSGLSLASCPPVRYSLKYLKNRDSFITIMLDGTFCRSSGTSDFTVAVEAKNATEDPSVIEGGDTGTTCNNIDASSTIELVTAAEYIEDNKLYTFSHWEADPQSATFDESTRAETIARNFTASCSIHAHYTWVELTPGPANTNAVTPAPEESPAPTEAPTPDPTAVPTDAPTAEITPPPTQAPTDAPTEAPTQAPTDPPIETPDPTPDPTPEPTPEPHFTLTVASHDNFGAAVTDTYENLTYDSVVYISTASTFPTGPTYQTFKGWNGGPCASIDNPGATSTSVRYFTSDCSIGAAY